MWPPGCANTRPPGSATSPAGSPPPAWPASGSNWNCSSSSSRCSATGSRRLLQQGGDLGAGRVVVVGREGDVGGVGARLEQGLDGAGPVGVGVEGGLFAAADGRPHQRVAVPVFVARLDVGAAVQEQPDRVHSAGKG